MKKLLLVVPTTFSIHPLPPPFLHFPFPTFSLLSLSFFIGPILSSYSGRKNFSLPHALFLILWTRKKVYKERISLKYSLPIVISQTFIFKPFQTPTQTNLQNEQTYGEEKFSILKFFFYFSFTWKFSTFENFFQLLKKESWKIRELIFFVLNNSLPLSSWPLWSLPPANIMVVIMADTEPIQPIQHTQLVMLLTQHTVPTELTQQQHMLPLPLSMEVPTGRNKFIPWTKYQTSHRRRED